MGSVASDVGNFVSDTVSSVGDIGQSVIDAGSDVIDSVGTGISDAAQSVSDAFAQIDPGPAIGDAGVAIDQAVNDTIPGGWAMVGAIALTVASMGTVDLEGEVLAAEAAAEAAEAGVAASEGAAAVTATETAAAAGNTAAQSALQAAATGAAKGAAIGAAKSAITGGDVLDGALSGALTGAVGGGVGNFAGSALQGTDYADYAKLASAVAGGTAGGATGAAVNGGDIGTGALIGGLSGATSNLASNIIPSDVNPAVTSGVLGALKSAALGGDPLTGALTSAGGSLLGQGATAAYDAVKGALSSDTTQTANNETQYAPLASNVTSDQPTPLVPSNVQGTSVTQAAFTSPFLLDANGNLMYDANGQPIPNPLANQSTSSEGVTSTADRGSPLSQAQIDAANELESKLNSGEITREQYDQQLSAIENQTNQSDIVINAGGLPSNTSTSTVQTNTPTVDTSTSADGSVTTNTDTSPSIGSTDAVGKFLGDVVGGLGSILGGVFGGTGTGGTGSGGSGSGSGGSGTGSGGTGTIGTSTTIPTYTQDATAGLVNLTPGLTKPSTAYTLSGLSGPQGGYAPETFATGGSTTSSSSLFDSKGNYNYSNLSDTPLSVGLTKANVGYSLTGLPHKADGGSVGDFHPQFYSEGGASMANRYVQGAGDGTSDSIPAMLANGEFVIPADIVSSLGNGSNDSGAKILDEFLRVIREHKQKHDARRLPPNSKGPLSYLTDAKRKVKK